MWSRDEDAISYSRKLKRGTVQFQARELRRDATGIQGRLDILFAGVRLAFSRFHIERDADRVRVANRAYEKFGSEERDEWPEREFKHAFDLFCAELWPRWVERVSAKNLSGQESRPSRFSLTPYVLEEGGSIAFGPPGAGKSWLLYLVAQSLHHGVDTLWPCVQRRVLIVNLERPEKRVAHRLASVNRILGLPDSATLPVINARGGTFADIEPAIRSETKRLGAEVLFCDSLSRAGFGKLIADEVANLSMDAFNRLAASWFLVAHQPRGKGEGQEHVFGSTMFEAAADLTLRVWCQERGKVLGIAVKGDKANDVPRPPLRIYACRFDDEMGLVEFRRAEKGEFRELEVGEPSSLADEIADLLLMTDAMSASDIAAELGADRSKCVRILRSQDRFAQAGRDGHKVLYKHTSCTA